MLAIRPSPADRRRRSAVTLFGLAAIAAVSVFATGAAASTRATSDVCVLLPDSNPSVRWEEFDRGALDKALGTAGLSHRIFSAGSDPQKQRSQADECLAHGVKVLIVVPLDSGSASAIEKKARAKGVQSIDYDRQVEGGAASLYVSFDGHQVGVLEASVGVVGGLKKNGRYSRHPVVAELNGGQEDANSFFDKGGYDHVLGPLYKNGTFQKGPDQFVPAWNGQNAATIFQQMLVSTNDKIDAVLAANDGLANAVVKVLKAHKLKPIPLSGQDATVQGVQNIISGWQTMTVFKDVRKLAAVAAQAALQIVHGKAPEGTTVVQTRGRGSEPAILLAPQPITRNNWTILIRDHFLKKADVCTAQYARYC
jgi:D-xylose transport system substrate-binding protein